jgi:hypothetical protein
MKLRSLVTHFWLWMHLDEALSADAAHFVSFLLSERQWAPVLQ